MKTLRFLAFSLLLAGAGAAPGAANAAAESVDDALRKIDTTRGIVCLLDLPADGTSFVVDLAKASELTLYFQSADEAQTRAVRVAASKAGLLGSRVFADSGKLNSIHLGDNLADSVLVFPSAVPGTSDDELLRVLRPRATAHFGSRSLVKPVPAGIDDWSHPYHGPDNNPQSTDQLARGQFRTQFIADPKFSPMPEQTVSAGGRLFKAMGHIAHKANQNAMLNTLLCINAYNGIILWKKSLPEGFMIHRNTMIATGDALYMGDHESCKIIDARTGEVRDEITVPADITDGPVWKWMGMRGDTLFALVGNTEVKVDTQKAIRRGLGHWPWGMWEGHDYSDPRTSFGFGRTLVAIDLKTKKPIWHYRDDGFLDARAICMNRERIFCYSPEEFLLCIDAASGKRLWKTSDAKLLAAIGPNEPAQHYVTGYATTAYMKCNDDYLFFAGPQRAKMVTVSAETGNLAWTRDTGNLQLVLRADAVYAAGAMTTDTGGARLDYATGEVLSEFPARRACTRATGTVDSVFFRARGGTVRFRTDSQTAQHIAPMRPPCQDGVLIANGHLYWGPWMCGCELSLYGNIGLGPAGADSPGGPDDIYEDALVVHSDGAVIESLDIRPGDWTRYRGDDSRSDKTAVKLPARVTKAWTTDAGSGDLPTAPVTAGGLVFIADRTGVVRALDIDGKTVWKTYTAGPVYYPPAVSGGRLFVGSGDGRVHAFEARTGRPLWTFRVGPEDRLIPVFGKLISRWPVAGGVAVEGDTVYAAAGITHYDGTFVVALDAVTGKLKAHNSSSGTLSREVDSGISMQGNLTIVDGELRFLGGGVYETARYDLATLSCLNTPREEVTSQFRTAFYPYYPDYGKYVSLEHKRDDGSILCHDAAYEGSMFGNLALQEPLAPGMKPIAKDEAGEFLRRRGRGAPEPKNVWQDKTDRRFTSFIVSSSGDQLLAAGHPDEKPGAAFLALTNIEDGSDAWLQRLPAVAVKGGTAIDHTGRIFVALENGELICFEPDEN